MNINPNEIYEEMLVEVTSLQEAVSQAVKLWNVEECDVEAEIIDEGKRLFGLFGKKLSVKLVLKYPMTVVRAKSFAKELLYKMDLQADPQITEEHLLDLQGEDSAIIIGRYGETLKAMELLVNLVVRDPKNSSKVRLDCCGYRERREASLTRLAEANAREALRRRRAVALEPMSSWERRVIHLALQENEQVETKSIGEDPFRKVLITPRGCEASPSRSRRRY